MTIGVQPQLGNLIDLLSLLNSSVNFILYSTMSNLFRNEFLQTFGQLCCCFNAKNCAQHQRRFLKNPILSAFNGRNRLSNRASAERHVASLSADNGAEKVLLSPASKYRSDDAITTASTIVEETSYNINSSNKSFTDRLNLVGLTVTSNGNTVSTIVEKPLEQREKKCKENGAESNISYLMDNGVECISNDEIC